MVLEDVESDSEGQQKCQDQAKAAVPSTSLTSPPPPTADQQNEDTQQAQINSLRSQLSSDTTLQSEPLKSGINMAQEDAETQTGRWTPFIESIKREAEDVALATMEER